MLTIGLVFTINQVLKKSNKNTTTINVDLLKIPGKTKNGFREKLSLIPMKSDIQTDTLR